MDHKYSHNQLNRNIEHDERKQTQYVRDTSSNIYYATISTYIVLIESSEHMEVISSFGSSYYVENGENGIKNGHRM
jgi:hypothetical protein